MNKKLSIALAIIVFSNYIAAEESNFFTTIGRSYNGNSTIVPNVAPETISFKDAKDLKKQMREISKNVSGLAAGKKDEIQAKVTKLDSLVKSYQIKKQGKMKTSKRQ